MSMLTRKQAGDPILLLHFYNVHIMRMFITSSFKKSLIVGQFQGNYLNPHAKPRQM